MTFFDREEKQFLQFCKDNLRDASADESRTEILVDLFPSTSSIVVFRHFLPILSQKLGARLVGFSTEYGPRAFLRRWTSLKKIKRIYSGLGVKDSVVVRNFSHTASEQARAKTQEFRDSKPTKESLLRLQAESITIGDLVYDSYLRDYFLPTVDFDDNAFWEKLEFGFKVLYFWLEYLNTHDVRALVVSHEVYIQYGIVARLIMALKRSVYIAGDMALHRLDEARFLCSFHYVDYRSKFANLSDRDKAAAISESRDKLERRLSGDSNEKIIYADKMAYGNVVHSARVLRESGKFKVLIATHCFMDNPHGYRWMVFPDFWEWLEFLGQKSEELDYDFYLKTHIDVLKENLPIIEKIVAKYPRITWIPSTTTHNQLLAEGIDAALTVHGSIAYEYAYLGKTVLCAGDGPHEPYSFAYLARSKEEYTDHLKRLPELSPLNAKQQILEFYYMHYVFHSVPNWFFNKFDEYLGRIGGYGARHGSSVYKYYIDAIGSRKNEIERVERVISNFLESGCYYLDQSMFES